jgi:hypothetical protein
MKEINKWMCKKNGKATTHLLLDGGTLSVVEDSFYEDYIGDILHGERLCVVEKKTTPHFRFFVDVDFVSDENELDFVKVSLVISKILSDLGPCVLARARPRPVEGGLKYGLHIIWPESVVTKQRANSLRMRILSEMGSDWEKIIDASVYAGSGLRMVWSHKNDPNSTPYIPWGEIRDGTWTEFTDKNPSVEYLKLFSIRILESSVNTHHHLENPPSDSSSELEMYIRTNIPGQEYAKIIKVSKCKNKKDYWIGTTSKYCEHVKREHKSNHVWFCLRPSGMIAQKCQDDECKGYTGRFYRIPSRLIPNEGSVADTHRCTINDYLPDGWKKI